ncbi:hypothetical protein CEXT_717941 [Caerostris extrusa]|uniref:Uncharacterized protein n=1 Tax=Caerostris extrusa TaxID=172846 RepID=A0AAV4YDV6_CAEEX|nr:hypothetical protein CEXT_717941 [Caerostris extrusa]
MGDREGNKIPPADQQVDGQPSKALVNFSKDCDISKSSLDATASGAAEATRPAVRGHVDKYATRTINVLQLNINGTPRKVAELSDILHTNIISRCLLAGDETYSELIITER